MSDQDFVLPASLLVTDDVYPNVEIRVGNTVANTNAITVREVWANGTNGNPNEILTSDGTYTYWAPPTAVFGVNTYDRYTWVNNHTFTMDVYFGNSTVNSTINSTTYSGTANNASYLQGNTVSDIRLYADNKAANAYSNAISYSGNAAQAYSNAIAYSGNAAQAYSNAIAYSGNSVAAYVNATSYADTKAATAYSNAIAYSGNAAQAYANAIAYSTAYSGNAAQAYSNAIAYSGNAAQAYTNAVSYANNTFLKLSGGTLTGNLILGTIGVSANSSYGSSGQVLTTNGSSTYWSTISVTGGTVTSVNSGNGLTGGPITSSGTLSVLANTGVIANSTGVFVNSAYIATISSNNSSFLGGVAAASYVQNTDSRTLSGNIAFTGANNSFSGNTGFGVTSPISKIDISGGIVQNVVTVAASAVDCSAGNYFIKTASGALSWTVTNVPASRVYSFILELTNGGTGTQTWFTGTKWPGGTAPTLVASGVDVLGFITDDGGTTWRGVLLMSDSK